MTGIFDPFRYDGEEIVDILDREIPDSVGQRDSDFFLYVMGPYTPFDANYVKNQTRKKGNKLQSKYIDDPLFDPQKHLSTSRSGYEEALVDLCNTIRNKYPIRAFVATEVDIPTPSQATSYQGPGMTPLEQSMSFTAVSHAVVFIFSHAGLNAGVGTELGCILSNCNLRPDNTLEAKKPRQRFKIFSTPHFGSATVSTASKDFAIDDSDFQTKDSLLDQIEQFSINVERSTKNKQLDI